MSESNRRALLGRALCADRLGWGPTRGAGSAADPEKATGIWFEHNRGLHEVLRALTLLGARKTVRGSRSLI